RPCGIPLPYDLQLTTPSASQVPSAKSVPSACVCTNVPPPSTRRAPALNVPVPLSCRRSPVAVESAKSGAKSGLTLARNASPTWYTNFVRRRLRTAPEDRRRDHQTDDRQDPEPRSRH